MEKKGADMSHLLKAFFSDRKRRVFIVVAVLCLIASAGWWGYNRFFSERANPSIEEYPIRGIDISAHNGEVDYTRLRGAGVQFAYIKSTEGADFCDRRFMQNATGLRRAGIPTGAYHFFRFNRDGEMQAWNFINSLKGRRVQLPPAVDVEEWGNADGVHVARIRRELRRMLDVLQREGYDPIVYSNKNGYQRYLRGHFDDYPLWICSFTDPPLDDHRQPWVIWQYSHRGSVEGISGSVDFNTIHPSHPLAAVVSSLNILADSVKCQIPNG